MKQQSLATQFCQQLKGLLQAAACDGTKITTTAQGQSVVPGTLAIFQTKDLAGTYTKTKLLVLDIGFDISLLTLYAGLLELLVELFNAMNCNKSCNKGNC